MRLGLGLLLIVLCPLSVRGDEKEPRAAEKFLGTYTIQSGERDGEKIPADRLEEVRVTIGKESISTFDREGKTIYVARYELMQIDEQPWKISMAAVQTPRRGEKGVKTTGLITWKGDTVKLIYALPGGETPRNFETGKNQHMFVLKKKER